MPRALLLIAVLNAGWTPGDTLELEVGETRVIRIPGLQRVAVSNVSCYDVKTLGRDQLLFQGTAEGGTTVLVWTAKGERFSIPLKIVPARPRVVQIPTTSAKGVVVRPDGGTAGQVDVFEVPVELKDVRQVSEVDGGLHLVGTDANGARYDLVLTPRP
jgi:Flp pilus assembly secretin CpaC